MLLSKMVNIYVHPYIYTEFKSGFGPNLSIHNIRTRPGHRQFKIQSSKGGLSRLDWMRPHVKFDKYSTGRRSCGPNTVFSIS